MLPSLPNATLFFWRRDTRSRPIVNFKSVWSLKSKPLPPLPSSASPLDAPISSIIYLLFPKPFQVLSISGVFSLTCFSSLVDSNLTDTRSTRQRNERRCYVLHESRAQRIQGKERGPRQLDQTHAWHAQWAHQLHQSTSHYWFGLECQGMFQVLFGDRFLKTHFFVKESPLEPTHLIKPAVPPRPPSARGAPPRPPRPSCGVPPPPPPPPAPLAPPPPVEKVEEQATVALFKEINSKGLDITQGYKSVALRVCVFCMFECCV